MIWSIAGSDPSSGAGLQADLKTATVLGVDCATVVTSVTAQNARRFLSAEAVDATLVHRQIESLKDESPPRVIKLGMLHSREVVRTIVEKLKSLDAEVICDPVLQSSSGAPLLSDDARVLLRDELFPLVDVLTPNRREAEALVGRALNSPVDIERAARELERKSGFTVVLIKGGHGDGPVAHDYFHSAGESFWLASPRQPEGAAARGTGCTFAAALASFRAQGKEWGDAAVLAKAFLNQALRLRSSPTRLDYRPWSPQAELFPVASSEPPAVLPRPFPSCGPRALGFYPIVDRAQWLQRLLPLGVSTVQLRIKDLGGAELDREIATATQLARSHDSRLFINDHWELAIRHQAYGVHLGQEDLQRADIGQIRAAGLRLGLSTHSELELARALAIRPSYIALGPIYPTTLKAMRFAPQGIDRLRHWCELCDDIPVVAIGGFSLDRARGAVAAGASAIAVVSDITARSDAEERARDWLRFSEESFGC